MNSIQRKFEDFQIILASGSPRRQELLKGLDLSFSVVKPDFNEDYPNHLKAQEITEFIVKHKSNQYTQIKPNQLIIFADTIVWFNQKALMKPKNFVEAIDILSQLNGETHEVITSVLLKTTQKEVVFTEKTKVTFSDLYPSELMYYVDKYKPFDKAGAYAIQEWIGYRGIKKIEGCYYTIMGLPVHRLYEALNEF